MCVRVWALMRVRLRVRLAYVRVCVRARIYASVIIVLYHYNYVRAQFVSKRVRTCVHICVFTYVHANVLAYCVRAHFANASACV